MVSISYCITTHNEGAIYLRPLFERLLKYLQPEDEIVVVDDNSTEETTVQTLSDNNCFIMNSKSADCIVGFKNVILVDRPSTNFGAFVSI